MSPEGFQDDLGAIGRIGAVPAILDILCRTTGMGFAAVARVTEDRWIACAVRDLIGFGLQPGGELDVATTICREVRQARSAVLIDHVAEDATYCGHPTPAMYGFQSYISVPIMRRNGDFFGTLCAIDPRPARVNTPETAGTVRLFADLIAAQLDADERLAMAETVQRSDALTRSILAATPDCVKVLSAEGTVEFMNERGVELNQLLSAADVVGQEFAAMWPPPEQERIRSAVRQAAAGEMTRVSGFCPTARGEPRWWEASFAPFHPDGSEAGILKIVGVSRDISDRTQAEERLRELQGKQEFLLHLGDTIRPLHDPVEVQAEACRLLGDYLSVAQVGFGEIDATQNFVTIHREWNGGRLPSIAGTWRMDDFGPAFVADMRRGETAVIPDIARDRRTGAPEVLAAYARIGIRAVLNVPLVKRGRMVAVLFIHHPGPRPWSPAEVELVEETCGRLWEAAERVRAEAAMRESEGRLGAALAAARLGSFEWNLQSNAVTLDDRSREIFALSEGEGARAEEVFARIHPDDFPRVRAEAEAAAGAMMRLVTEYRIVVPGGGVRFVASLSDAKPGANGTAERMVGVFADVTDRRAAEDRQALLAREVNHRAKNALAVVQSVVHLTPARDLATFKQAVGGRISALARAQTLLAEDHWRGADLRTLLVAELAPFLGDRRVELDGAAVAVSPGAAQPMAMAFHELATNAVKYGALSVGTGRLAVSWWLDWGRKGAATLHLRWTEVGGPPITAPPGRAGFGSRVLDNTLRGQLSGEVLRAWEPSGLVCTIVVPMKTGPESEGVAAGQ